jgi:hypothetical protein
VQAVHGSDCSGKAERLTRLTMSFRTTAGLTVVIREAKPEP